MASVLKMKGRSKINSKNTRLEESEREEQGAAYKFRIQDQLINLVKSYPIIYDKRHPDHANRILIANTWAKISEELEVNQFAKSGSECKDMWGSLWKQYRNYKNKQKAKLGQGTAKKPLVFGHSASMAMFDDTIMEETIFTNIQVEQSTPASATDLGQTIQEPSIRLTNENVASQSAQSSQESMPMLAEIRDSNSQDSTASREPKKRSSRSHCYGRKRANHSIVDDKVQRALLDFIERVQNEEEDDEFDDFGNEVALRMRRMSEWDAEICWDLESAIKELIHTQEIEARKSFKRRLNSLSGENGTVEPSGKRRR